MKKDKETQILSRKIKITIVGSEEERKIKYRWIRNEQYNQYRALNIGIGYLNTHHILQSNGSSLELRKQKEINDIGGKITKLSDELIKQNNKKKIDTGKTNKLNCEIKTLSELLEKTKIDYENAKTYRNDIDDKFSELYLKDLYNSLNLINFQYADTKSLVQQRVKDDFSTSLKNGMARGERKFTNYKRDYPLMTRGRDLKFYYEGKDVYIKWIQGIIFKCVLGKPSKSLELRHTLHKAINGEYEISGSSFQFNKENELILNLALKMEIENNHEKTEGRIVGVDLGLKIPAFCGLNDDKFIRKPIGNIDDFLRVRTQMNKRRERLTKSLVSVTGGKGRDYKMRATDRFKEKEKNFAKTYNHFVSKNIIEFAIKNKASQINLELLKMDETKENSTILRNWGYYQLQQFIEYKAKMHGIEVKYVDPYLTSQTCSECGHYEPGQREKQEEFICKKCGIKINADFNASRNIAMSQKYITDPNESEYHKNKENNK